MSNLPFIDQFAIAKKNIRATLFDQAGKSMPPFKVPTADVKANIQFFLKCLQDYENNPTSLLMLKLNSLIGSLDLGVLRPSESPNDVLLFYPKAQGNKQPYKVGATILWRFGKMCIPGKPETYDNHVSPFGVSNEHETQDDTMQLGIDAFYAGAKFAVFSACDPHALKGRGNIKYYSDPSHSDRTIFVQIMKQLLQDMYPYVCIVNNHGMVGNAKNFQLLMVNNFNGQFLKNGARSFTSLLALALAVQDFDNTRAIVVASNLPGNLLVKGKTVPLISKTNPNSVLRIPSKAHNTNVIGHIANGASNVFSRGVQSDRAAHLEFQVLFRQPGSKRRKRYIKALKLALKWYTMYDPEIHNLWKLAERFPKVHNNLYLYDSLFAPEFIAQYKAKSLTERMSGVEALQLTAEQMEDGMADLGEMVDADEIDYSYLGLNTDEGSDLDPASEDVATVISPVLSFSTESQATKRLRSDVTEDNSTSSTSTSKRRQLQL